MRLLLTTLNAKYIHSNLALRYLYESGRRAGLSADQLYVKEFTINNEAGYVYGEILRGQFDIVCFSCYIWNIRQICDLAADLKKTQPSLIILLGGPEVSYEADAFLQQNPWADGILRGEGETAFEKLCADLQSGLSVKGCLSGLPSLIWRDGDCIRDNEMGEVIEMAALPFPYENLPPAEDKVVYYEASRGCPYRCSYCLSSLEKTIRPLPLERTLSELSWFLDAGIRQVKFIDRTFNFDKQRAKSIWQYLIDHDNGTTNFHFEICAALLDDSCQKVIAGARKGLFQFEIGIQSCNAAALAAIDRVEDMARALKNIRSLVAMGNSHIHVDLIAGLPYEDYESFALSFDTVYELGADNLQLGFLKLLKGTKIREQAEEYGYLQRSYAPYQILASRWMSALDMDRLAEIEAVLELYHNKGGFSQTVQMMIAECFDGSAFGFYEKLAVFFYGQGFQHRSHKKEDLYRILLLFVEHTVSSDVIKERAGRLLMEDLEKTMNFDAVKKFYKKGWNLQWK
ncbi:DUF4080 domain-containing protein [Ihubacter sp. rT4E-8]|uniref:B12-binding domain-containing radical SAM protein n=1 Tax=Ihubacter sp. rT4E-8 TaxID=3242369 RepID=UPI003CEDB2A5